MTRGECLAPWEYINLMLRLYLMVMYIFLSILLAKLTGKF